MKKIFLLLVSVFIVLGVSAQELDIKKEYSIHDYQNNPTLLKSIKERSGGVVYIKDTCKSIRAQANAWYNFDYNDEFNPLRIAFDKAGDKTRIALARRVPKDILQILKQHLEKKRKLQAFFINIYFDKKGNISSLGFILSEEIYEQMSEEQIKRLYREIKKEKIALAEFYNFTENRTVASVGADIFWLIEKGKLKLPK